MTTATRRATRAVTFQPQNARAMVPEGTLVLDAAAQAGVFLEIPCGAQGRCGRCKVRVDDGAVAQAPNPHLTTAETAEGWVLACAARIHDDTTLFVPDPSQRLRAVIDSAAARTAADVVSPWPPLPQVARAFVGLPPPTLDDNAADLDRLSRALARELGVSTLRLSLPQLQALPGQLRDANWQVTAAVELLADGSGRLVALRPGRPRGAHLGLAIDIGTTTVVAYLVDLRRPQLIGSASAFNRQIGRGEDVISRIVYSQRGDGAAELRHLVLDTINALLAQLAKAHRIVPTQIDDVVVAGNTTMIHLLLGLPARGIRQEPYAPVAVHLPNITAATVGIDVNPEAPIHCLPSVAAYVGGDITAGVLASGMWQRDRLTLFMDMGTNGELVLGRGSWMITCACSAGPAFEGAGVVHGMRAIEGAIEDVRISSQTLEPTLGVIGDTPPRGICGSGMISALAELFVTGVVDRRGRMNAAFVQQRMGARSRVRRGSHGHEYVFAYAADSGSGDDIVLTEVDIDNLVRTKAAIYAGITSMTSRLSIAVADIEEVLIGGAFGQHLNIEQAIQIGLLPDLPWERFRFLGNTSALGAFMALHSRQARAKAAEIANTMTYLELIADNTFYNEFNAARFLPHTDLSSFPSVKALLEPAAAA